MRRAYLSVDLGELGFKRRPELLYLIGLKMLHQHRLPAKLRCCNRLQV